MTAPMDPDPSSGRSITANIKLTPDRLKHLSRHEFLVWLRRRAPRSLTLWALAIGGVTLAQGGAISVAVALLAIIMMGFDAARGYRHFKKETARLTGREATIVLDLTGVEGRFDDGETKAKWHAFECYNETDYAFFLRLPSGGHWMLPKDCFSDESAVERARELISKCGERANV